MCKFGTGNLYTLLDNLQSYIRNRNNMKSLQEKFYIFVAMCKEDIYNY